MKVPSTAWREAIAADEAAQHSRMSEIIADVQRKNSAKFGAGRALHRKAVASMRGRLEIATELPTEAAHGVFVAGKTYDVWARLSNGGPDLKANTKPDIRGFALRLLDVHGEGALGGPTDHQDFLFINHDRFSSRNSDEFAGIVRAAAKSPLAVLAFLIRTHGWRRGFSQVKTLTATLKKPFASFATEAFNTVLPHTVGPYAARIGLVPLQHDAPLVADVGADLVARLSKGSVAYDLTLQLFVDEALTPIEDPTVVWSAADSAPVVVGRVTFEQQSADGAFAEQVERAKFDPWGGLAVHRPLGEIMRARKAAYFVSQKARGV
jgi:catalase